MIVRWLDPEDSYKARQRRIVVELMNGGRSGGFAGGAQARDGGWGGKVEDVEGGVEAGVEVSVLAVDGL